MIPRIAHPGKPLGIGPSPHGRTIARIGFAAATGQGYCDPDQLSKATPRKSPWRQFSRHMRMVRKLSKDNAKSSDTIFRSWVRMPAPRFVMSQTVQECTPVFSLKNINAPLEIFVLPIDRRSNAFSH